MSCSCVTWIRSLILGLVFTFGLLSSRACIAQSIELSIGAHSHYNFHDESAWFSRASLDNTYTDFSLYLTAWNTKGRGIQLGRRAFSWRIPDFNSEEILTTLEVLISGRSQKFYGITALQKVKIGSRVKGILGLGAVNRRNRTKSTASVTYFQRPFVDPTGFFVNAHVTPMSYNHLGVIVQLAVDVDVYKGLGLGLSYRYNRFFQEERELSWIEATFRFKLFQR